VAGFDAVFPAAFLALLAPLLTRRAERGTALLAVAVSLALVALGAPPGLPVLVAAVAALPSLWLARRRLEPGERVDEA
jgi:predicted branched-subunit amino acid permease